MQNPKNLRFSFTVRLPGSAAYTPAKLVRASASSRFFAKSTSPMYT